MGTFRYSDGIAILSLFNLSPIPFCSIHAICFYSSKSFKVTKGADLVKTHNTSPPIDRCFCPKCGTGVYNKLLDYPELIETIVATYDDVKRGKRPPKELRATNHLHYDSRIIDILPKYANFPKEMGGSGDLIDEKIKLE